MPKTGLTPDLRGQEGVETFSGDSVGQEGWPSLAWLFLYHLCVLRVQNGCWKLLVSR